MLTNAHTSLIFFNLTLDTPVQYIPRVGPAMAKKLEKLGIITVRDLLYYAPFRYNDFSNITKIQSVIPGSVVCVQGKVEKIANVFTKNGKKIQQAVISDGTGFLEAVWFNQIYLPNVIHAGDQISLAGTIGFFGHKLVIESPEYELIKPDEQLLSTGRIVPVYSETEGLSSKWLRGRIAYVLPLIKNQLTEFLPEKIRLEYRLMPLVDAIMQVHFTSNLKTIEEARHRLAFDELFIMQLTSYEQKRLWQTTKKAPLFQVSKITVEKFINSLPFTLTNDQTNSLTDIINDLQKPYPMNRLLEGDVGSGKTVVAAAAMLIAVTSGFQSVLLAPTQILAEQHFATITKLLEPFDVSVELITANTNRETKNVIRNTRYEIRDTRYAKQKTNFGVSRFTSHVSQNVIIGTHALLEKTIQFENVGLIVIDEQQRFGVMQRAALKEKSKKGITAHVLTMTATPIPRSLALTLYGNLDLSTIKEMPVGRIPIKTWVVPKEKRNNAYQWIKTTLQKEQAQGFIICPFVNESESMSTVKAATNEFERLETIVYPDLKLALLHGKMKAKEKTAVLDQFKNKKFSILVATPVVEVGIDIPNAIIILIEAADRFGLSQLHQLRGRVGRRNKQSYCLLFTQSDKEETIKRLKSLETIHNGPDLAEVDLKIRGAGDLFGTRQHGMPPLALASLNNEPLILETKNAVISLTGNDPALASFPLLRSRLGKSKIEST